VEFSSVYQSDVETEVQTSVEVQEPVDTALHLATTDDLEIAFSRMPEEVRLGAQVVFRMIIEGKSRKLDPQVRNEACRIGREALLNAFRHSGASRVEVELEYAPRQLRIAVRDNGKGITEESFRSGSGSHRGLSGMEDLAKQMGAKLKLLSRAAAGTEVQLSIPAHIAFAPQTSVRRLGWAHV
jgi:signal transduction histidine kinase